MPTTERPPIEFVDVEKVTLSVAPKDADGRLVRDKTVSWSVVDQAADDGSADDVLTLEVAEDTLSAVALSGTPGTCVIEVRYDDPATDDDPVERMAIRIKTGEVSTLNLSAGAPVPE